MVEQKEHCYQQQEGVYTNAKKLLISKNKKTVRYYKDIGLGFKTPQEAIKGDYVDKKCPFTGNVAIRGKILRGMVISHKMKNTIVLRRDYLHYVKKYNRYEKRHTNIVAHCSPCFRVKEGDIVTVGECRPLAKTVNFNVLKVQENEIFGNARKQFALF